MQKIAFNTATFWDRNTQLLQDIAGSLGFSDDDLLDFFIDASKIKL